MHRHRARELAPYLTVPSETFGTERVTSREIWHWPRRMDIIRRASTSLRGAFTEAQPRYVSLLNTTLSSSVTGVNGLKSSQSRAGHEGECEKQGKAPASEVSETDLPLNKRQKRLGTENSGQVKILQESPVLIFYTARQVS